MIRMKENDIVVPGEKLASEEEYMHGSNTYVENSNIYATLLGRVAIKNGSIEVMPIGREMHADRQGHDRNGQRHRLHEERHIHKARQHEDRTIRRYLALKDGKIVIQAKAAKTGLQDRMTGTGPWATGMDPREEEMKPCKVGDTLIATVAYNDKDAYTLDIRTSRSGCSSLQLRAMRRRDEA